MKPILAFLKRKDLYLAIARYVIGIGMLPYAINKIVRVQLVLRPNIWQKTLEYLSGKELTWAFLGHSAWFGILLGFLELIPALLLLFRRTSLLGAILMLPITLNVFLINYALQLWHGSKQVATLFLILNCLIFLFEWKRIQAIVSVIIGKAGRYKLNGLEILINLAIVSVISLGILRQSFAYIRKSDMLTGDWFNQHPAEWTLQKEQLNDSILKPRDLRIYFSPFGYAEESKTDTHLTDQIPYKLNQQQHLLTLIYDQKGPIIHYNYFFLNDTTLKLERMIDSSENIRLTRIFTKRIINRNKQDS